MFKSILLTIYGLFLITYIAVMLFAQFRVYMFSKNIRLRGYSRTMSVGVALVVVVAIGLTLYYIRQFYWDDRVSLYFIKSGTIGEQIIIRGK